jgi:hypothetical protein
MIKKTLKIYPYEVGGFGTSVAQFLSGKAKLGRITPPPPTVFHDGTGNVVNTTMSNDYPITRCSTKSCRTNERRLSTPNLWGHSDRAKTRPERILAVARTVESGTVSRYFANTPGNG